MVSIYSKSKLMTLITCKTPDANTITAISMYISKHRLVTAVLIITGMIKSLKRAKQDQHVTLEKYQRLKMNC